MSDINTESIGMRPTIDPAEAMLAVIGMRPILSKEVEKVTMAQAREMANVRRNIYNGARDIVRGETFKVPFNPINYKKMLNELTDGYDEEQVVKMAAQFPPMLHAITSDFLVDAQKAVNFLLTLFPRAKKTGFAGEESIMPPAMAVARFTTTFDVLDDPMRILAYIATGSLLKSQVTAAQMVYPSILGAIKDAFEEALTNEVAKKKSFQIPARVQIGLAVLNGVPRLPASLQNRLQQNYADAQKEKPEPKQGAEGTATSVIAKESITNTQRALYPQTSKAG